MIFLLFLIPIGNKIELLPLILILKGMITMKNNFRTLDDLWKFFKPEVTYKFSSKRLVKLEKIESYEMVEGEMI